MKLAAIFFILLEVLSTLVLALPLGLPTDPFALQSSKRALNVDQSEEALSRRSPPGLIAKGQDRLATSRLALQARKKAMKSAQEKNGLSNSLIRDEVSSKFKAGKASPLAMGKASYTAAKGRGRNLLGEYQAGKAASKGVLAEAKATKKDQQRARFVSI
jgi:hypothetical protein